MIVALCGFWPHATSAAADRLLGDNPALRLLRYRMPRPGALTRPGTGRIRTGDDPAAALVRDLVTAAGEHDGTGILALLPEAYEPDQLRIAWQAHAAPGTLRLITVVPADLVLDGLTDETPLRTVDLHRIAPWARHCTLDDARLPAAAAQSAPVTPVTRGLRGQAVGVHEPVPSHAVTACVFRARRPFHPGRLHDALGELTHRVLRSRGHFWLASRPGLVMGWESAGALTLCPVGDWLADQPDERWHEVPAERHIAAALDWDPYYGDRHHHLAFVGIDLDPVRLHRILTGCLLTDDELSRGEDAWRRLADPFARTRAGRAHRPPNS
jgi:hypothetical protein